MRAHVTDQHGDVLYDGPLPADPKSSAATAILSQRALLRVRSAVADRRLARDHQCALEMLIPTDRPAPPVQEDLQTVQRQPLDAPMAAWDRHDPLPPMGKWVLRALLLAATSFLGGLIAGRLS